MSAGGLARRVGVRADDKMLLITLSRASLFKPQRLRGVRQGLTPPLHPAPGLRPWTPI